jgi:addiction module RelE/StbE family toxin
MINFIWDQGFKRKYKKLVNQNETLKSLFWNKMELFTDNPFNPTLKTHKLMGRLNDCWVSTFDYDLRIVFQFLNDKTVLFLDISSHDEVY